MAGLDDLYQLLAGLNPRLEPPGYVFCHCENLPPIDCQRSKLFAMIREPEGWTLILPKAEADQMGLPGGSVFRCISLMVHSSLDAVGLTASVSALLTDAGISANMVAAYYHDHLFVPADRAEDALTMVQDLSARAQHAAQTLQGKPGQPA